MSNKKVPKGITKRLKSISNKRAKVVIDNILKHGSITTEELEKKYGYNHPPRAARDVREAGIPLETFWAKSSDGRRIAAYKFGDLTKIQKGRLGGRKVFPKKFKDKLYKNSNGRCAICAGHFESRYLQVDHRVPYEISGEGKRLVTKKYMLLCGSCNRAKSWSCEHCPNWLTGRSTDICSKCYWGNPDNYIHIALREVRRLDILWDKDEIRIYKRLKAVARKLRSLIPDYVKKIVAEHLEE